MIIILTLIVFVITLLRHILRIFWFIFVSWIYKSK